MPEQSSKRANAVTGSAFEAPFETHLVRFGVEGLNLKDEHDALQPTQASRLTNHDHDAVHVVALPLPG